MLSKSIAIIK